MTASPALFKRLLAALAGALALAVMLAPGSFAATYLVRPTGTVMQGSGWLVTPSGSTPDAVLNKNVTQPATPATSSFLTAGTSSNGQSTSVWVARPPALRSGETLKGLTAWAYLNTTASQSMTLSLYTWSFMGWQQLASASVPAGSSAGWYSARTQGALMIDPNSPARILECRPTMTFSSALMAPNRRMFWKVRATPALVITSGRS